MFQFQEGGGQDKFFNKGSQLQCICTGLSATLVAGMSQCCACRCTFKIMLLCVGHVEQTYGTSSRCAGQQNRRIRAHVWFGVCVKQGRSWSHTCLGQLHARKGRLSTQIFFGPQATNAFWIENWTQPLQIQIKEGTNK